jgi:hypothetical protein
LLVAWNSPGASAANRWPVSRVAIASSPTAPEAWVLHANGAVSPISGHFHGDARREPLAQPMKGIASTATGRGYWLVAGDGGVFAYGDARFHGSMAGAHLNAPIVGIAATTTGNGYWLVASDGGIFSFGDASFRGSTGSIALKQPVVGMAATPRGRGYWLTAADGGIFSFGDAHFYGSLAAAHLDQPIIGITASHSGKGYRLLARDGGVFSFGDAPFEGSLGGRGITDVVGFASTTSGNGYWILRRLGGTYRHCDIYVFTCGPEVPGPVVLNFGDAPSSPEPAFFKITSVKPVADPDVDFVGNPVVAIAPNPAVRGYIVLRAKGTTLGVGL